MSDQIAATGSQAPGQTPSEPAQQQYLTMDQVRDLLAETEANVLRRAQSVFDKRLQKVQATQGELDKTLKLLKEQGVEITPDVAEKVQQKAFQSAMLESESAPASPPASAQTPDAEGQLDPVTAMAVGFEKRYGVEIFDDDPEAKGIKTDGSPDEYVESYLAAIVAKKSRLQTQPTNPQSAQPRTPTNLAAGAPAAPERDPKQYKRLLSEALRGQ